MNIANGAEITLIKSTSVLHGKIKVGDFITKVDGTPVEKPKAE
jgi:C-terminal processing protease CtpA/Prc